MICIYSTEVVPGCVMELALLREVAVTTTNIFWILLSNAWWFVELNYIDVETLPAVYHFANGVNMVRYRLSFLAMTRRWKLQFSWTLPGILVQCLNSQLTDLARIVVLLIYIFYIIRL